jgi:hypothetical protein
MRTVGILTEEPRVYFDMLTALRSEGLKHVSLDFSEPIPANIAVIVSTEAERDRIPFDKVVTDRDPTLAIAKVKAILSGEKGLAKIVVGVDPGDRPGIAAVATDGTELARTQASCPETVLAEVDRIAESHSPATVVVRIGNGDRTNRNRIFNMLWDSGYETEIVDERNTTKRSKTPDEDAAYEIALTPGYAPKKRQEISPGPGEIRNIQRLSRLKSEGALTVSRDLAERVALGQISMEEAIARQRSSGLNGR